MKINWFWMWIVGAIGRVTIILAVALVAAIMVTAGCVKIVTNLQPVNSSVNAVLVGEDCTPIVFGIGFGHNTVERAQQTDVRPVDKSRYATSDIKTPITKIRVTSLNETYALIVGERCLEVVGEP
jgi:hypothetical protein